MAAKDLKKLPPEDRVKALKKLEEERKKEMDEARKLLKETEEEITEEKKWKERVPIPEATAADEEALSEEGRTILHVLRGSPKKQENSAAPSSAPRQTSLEETVEREAPKMSTAAQYELPREIPLEARNAEYAAEMSRRPAEELRQQAESLYRAAEERGYITWEEQTRAKELYAATIMKEKAAQQGAYPTFTEEVAQRTSLVKQLAGQLLHNAYEAKKITERTQHDWYKGV